MKQYDKAVDLYDVPFHTITPYLKNPRLNEKAVKYVMNTIQEVGFINPIIVDEEMVILAGHTRFIALKKLNYPSIPHVKQIVGLSLEKKRLYRLADNATNEAAEWDKVLLAEEVAAIKQFYDVKDYYINEPDAADLADETQSDSTALYPLVPQFSEKYDAIIVMFNNDIDFNNFKEKLGLEKVKSYKNSQTGELRVVWSDRLIKCLAK